MQCRTLTLFHFMAICLVLLSRTATCESSTEQRMSDVHRLPTLGNGRVVKMNDHDQMIVQKTVPGSDGRPQQVWSFWDGKEGKETPMPLPHPTGGIAVFHDLCDAGFAVGNQEPFGGFVANLKEKNFAKLPPLEATQSTVGIAIDRNATCVSGMSGIKPCIWRKGTDGWVPEALPGNGISNDGKPADTVTGMSKEGNFISGHAYCPFIAKGGGVQKPVVWELLPTGWKRRILSARLGGEALDVNSSGQATGWYMESASKLPCLWERNGELVPIQLTQGYSEGKAFSLNEGGRVVGYLTRSGGWDGELDTAFSWDATAKTQLLFPSKVISRAWCINNRNSVGSAYYADDADHAEPAISSIVGN